MWENARNQKQNQITENEIEKPIEKNDEKVYPEKERKIQTTSIWNDIAIQAKYEEKEWRRVEEILIQKKTENDLFACLTFNWTDGSIIKIAEEIKAIICKELDIDLQKLKSQKREYNTGKQMFSFICRTML